jgi:hypothetical protein
MRFEMNHMIKIKRSFITSLFTATALAGLALGQDDTPKPSARVIDEMERPNCERLQAAMDSAGTEMANNPAEMLFAVVYRRKGEYRAANGYGAQIGAWVKNRRFDPSRITIAFGPEGETLRVELIAVPPGAEPPKVETHWARRSPFDGAEIPRKAELITTETEDENPCFSDNRALEDLGEFLKENPAARARIVIKMSSVRDFNEETKVIRNTLSTEYGIASGRVRFVHVRTPAWPKGPMKETEYWLLPKASKK